MKEGEVDPFLVFYFSADDDLPQVIQICPILTVRSFNEQDGHLKQLCNAFEIGDMKTRRFDLAAGVCCKFYGLSNQVVFSDGVYQASSLQDAFELQEEHEPVIFCLWSFAPHLYFTQSFDPFGCELFPISRIMHQGY